MSTVRKYGTVRRTFKYGTVRRTFKYGTVRYGSFANTYLLDRTFSKCHLQISFTYKFHLRKNFIYKVHLQIYLSYI